MWSEVRRVWSEVRSEGVRRYGGCGVRCGVSRGVWSEV